MSQGKNGHYANCEHVQKVPFVNQGDQEIAKDLAASYDIPPLFESLMFEKSFMNHYSLTSNKYLSCRWREYVKKIEYRNYSPFQLPDARELHFHNCAIRFLPTASISNQDHRLKLKPGPGVDDVGQMPIPQEALMKRGTTVKAKAVRLDKNTAKV